MKRNSANTEQKGIAPEDIQSAVDALGAAADPLLRWYGQNARYMPWREDPKPYHVWLSEIMLQQTRVEAAREYYDRFLAALPDVKALAEAGEEELLKLWEGLGYYNRVRNLQKAAREVMARHGGRLPGTYQELLDLPGIGEYTAGAIGSIAFGLRVPAVDGNVYRVLSRLLAWEYDVELPANKKGFRQIAAALVPADRPGDFNQALMELGALICLPNGEPLCASCPLGEQCRGLRQGIASRLPVKTAKKGRRVERRTLLFAVADHKLLLFRRRERLLGGLYEPLNLAGEPDFEKLPALLPGARFIGEPAPLGAAIHVFSHVEWHMEAYRLRLEEPVPVEGGHWAALDELRERYPLPSAFRAYTKDLEALLGNCNAIS